MTTLGEAADVFLGGKYQRIQGLVTGGQWVWGSPKPPERPDAQEQPTSERPER